MVSARKLRVSPENTRRQLSRFRIFHTLRSHRADQTFLTPAPVMRRMKECLVRAGWRTSTSAPNFGRRRN